MKTEQEKTNKKEAAANEIVRGGIFLTDNKYKNIITCRYAKNKKKILSFIAL